MKAAGKYSYGGIFRISSRGLEDSSKKSVFCLLSSVFCILSLGLFGCSVFPHFQRSELTYEKLSAIYNRTKLKTNGSVDVLRTISAVESESGPRFTESHLLSQSDTAITLTGQSKNDYKTWMTLIALDESANGGMARRKYFYLVDEKAWVKPFGLRRIQFVPKQGLMFDSQVVVSAEVLDKSYVTEEARQITILKQVAEDLHKDVTEPGKDNQQLAVSGMLMNQVFKSILHKFEKSPSLARNLRDDSGVQFNHPNFDKGKIRMTINGNIVTVKIRSGVFLRIFDDQDLVKKEEK